MGQSVFLTVLNHECEPVSGTGRLCESRVIDQVLIAATPLAKMLVALFAKSISPAREEETDAKRQGPGCRNRGEARSHRHPCKGAPGACAMCIARTTACWPAAPAAEAAISAYLEAERSPASATPPESTHRRKRDLATMLPCAADAPPATTRGCRKRCPHQHHNPPLRKRAFLVTRTVHSRHL